MRMAPEGNPRQVVAMNGAAYGSPKHRRGKPLTLPLGQSLCGRFIEPEEFRIERRAQRMARARLLLHHAFKALRCKRRYQIQLAAQKPCQLNVMILLDVEANRTDIRQLATCGVALP